MSRILHPRPNPIVGAMYTLRDLDADVIIVHGPAGCGFMASRSLEEAGVRVLTTAMSESDLIFGAAEKLEETILQAVELFNPEIIGVVGTCSSMIIGEDLLASIQTVGAPCIVIDVDVHACMANNIEGVIVTMESAARAGLIDSAELERQKRVMRETTEMERSRGMASRAYLPPRRSPTKLELAQKVLDTLAAGGRVQVLMNAKKELTYRFADINLAVQEAADALGGEVLHYANLDTELGLPRIRSYARNISEELASHGIEPIITGGLDEYAAAGPRADELSRTESNALRMVTGIPHALPTLSMDDLLVTDQPRQLANYIRQGHPWAVGEIGSHSLVMGTKSIIPSETGETIRRLLEAMA